MKHIILIFLALTLAACEHMDLKAPCAGSTAALGDHPCERKPVNLVLLSDVQVLS